MVWELVLREWSIVLGGDHEGVGLLEDGVKLKEAVENFEWCFL